MIITVTVDISIERTDGTSTSIIETINHHAGDNPRFEAAEIGVAVDTAVSRLNARVMNYPAKETTA